MLFCECSFRGGAFLLKQESCSMKSNARAVCPPTSAVPSFQVRAIRKLSTTHIHDRAFAPKMKQPPDGCPRPGRARAVRRHGRRRWQRSCLADQHGRGSRSPQPALPGQAGDSSPGQSAQSCLEWHTLGSSAAGTPLTRARHSPSQRPSQTTELTSETSQQKQPASSTSAPEPRNYCFQLLCCPSTYGNSQRTSGFAKPASALTNPTRQPTLEKSSATLRKRTFGLALRLHRAELLLFDPGRRERKVHGKYDFFYSYITALESFLRIHY